MNTCRCNSLLNLHIYALNDLLENHNTPMYVQYLYVFYSTYSQRKTWRLGPGFIFYFF